MQQNIRMAHRGPSPASAIKLTSTGIVDVAIEPFVPRFKPPTRSAPKPRLNMAESLDDDQADYSDVDSYDDDSSDD